MEDRTTNFDRIEAYLFGQMTQDETTNFEQEIAQNNDLALEVENQRLEHRAMELMLREELQANLQFWKVEKDQEATAEPGSKTVSINRSRRLMYRLSIAACILLIAGFFSRQFFASSPDYEAIAMDGFGYSETTSRGTTNDPLAPVFQSMKSKNYREALTQLGQIPGDYQKLTVLNLRGECSFYLKEYDQAIANYQQILQANPDGDLREKAEWRTLLCMVAKGEKGAALDNLLEKVISEGGQFKERAKQLKDQIK